MTEVRQGPTLRVRSREMSALTRHWLIDCKRIPYCAQNVLPK